VRKLIDGSYARVKELLTQNQERLRTLTKVLLEKETLEGEEIRRVLGLPEKKKEA
jgi:cell division protease FtsH